MDLIDSFVFGLITVPSLGGSQCYVSFIDNFFKTTWLYFLRKKCEVFKRFQEFKTLVENQTGKNIKVLETNNGGELCDKAFNQFCRQHDIAQQNKTPYTPQQNRVTEGMNRMLMEKERSMLRCENMAHELWAEVVDTLCYLVNRSPSTTVVFECEYFVHAPKEKRRKLDNKLDKCIFIGYKDGVKGYKLWNPVTMKTTHIREVIFK